jgi:exopolyphosphatase/guanosine-5'-triphosphate,3'-diphosphate pyrophosphatase
MDIGGGSVEFIIANKHSIAWKQSFETGAAMLLEKFMPSDPITVSEINEIKLFLETALQPLFIELETTNLKPGTLIGSSGSFETLVDLISAQFSSPRVTELNTEYDIDYDAFVAIHQQLIASTTVQRMQMKGMIEMRVDMMVIASVLINFILEKTGIRKIKLSTFALKEGILFEALKAEEK